MLSKLSPNEWDDRTGVSESVDWWYSSTADIDRCRVGDTLDDEEWRKWRDCSGPPTRKQTRKRQWAEKSSLVFDRKEDLSRKVDQGWSQRIQYWTDIVDQNNTVDRCRRSLSIDQDLLSDKDRLQDTVNSDPVVDHRWNIPHLYDRLHRCRDRHHLGNTAGYHSSDTDDDIGWVRNLNRMRNPIIERNIEVPVWFTVGECSNMWTSIDLWYLCSAFHWGSTLMRRQKV